VLLIKIFLLIKKKKKWFLSYMVCFWSDEWCDHSVPKEMLFDLIVRTEEKQASVHSHLALLGMVGSIFRTSNLFSLLQLGIRIEVSLYNFSY
jgi:hypothetical protein